MTRIIIILITFIITGNTSVFSQIKRDSVIKETKNYYCIVNNQNYILKNSDGKFKILLNDSTIYKKQKGGCSISGYYKSFKQDTFYLCLKRGTNSSILSIIINSGEIDIKEYFFKKNSKILKVHKDKIIYQELTTDSNIDRLFLRNNTKNTEKKLTLINKILKEKINIGETITFPFSNHILISIGLMEQGGFLNPKYYLYNIKENSLNEFKVPKKLQSIFGEYGVWLSHYNLDKSYAFLDSIIIDSNFNYFSSYLRGSQASEIRGFVFSDNELKRLIVISEIDETNRYGTPTYVLIQYTPSPHRERIMYRLYHNKIITREELQRFDAFELRLFRNMIFAKYNYDFNDKYLTAYFNMYSFYRPHKDTRTKDMSGKLTKADTQNLELIKSMEEKK